MLEIWWIRHASTDWNRENRWQGHTDVELSDTGRTEARLLGARLRHVPFDQVWTSDLVRCAETCRLALPEAEIRLDARLREMPMGLLEGRTWSDAEAETRQRVDAWWRDPYGQPFPGGTEGLREVTERVEAWRAALPETGRIAAFTHGGVIRCCLWRLTGPPRDRSWSVDLGNTAITRIRYGRGRPALVTLNDTAHLGETWDAPPGQKVPGE